MPKTFPEKYPPGWRSLCGSLVRIYNSQVRIQTFRSLKEASKGGCREITNWDDEQERLWRIVIGIVWCQVVIKRVSRQIKIHPGIVNIHLDGLALTVYATALGKAGYEAGRCFPNINRGVGRDRRFVFRIC